MTIEKFRDGDKMTIALEGKLDTTTAPELEAEWMDVRESVSELVIDLEKLEYMSSAGLRAMLVMQKYMMQKGGMKVVHVNEIIMEIFEITGFTTILDIE
ncbi:MAG: STAS domain-containing protein [Firmicutes bacterium]|nr:STAS domain-containing protein [Bacillota bacterium]